MKVPEVERGILCKPKAVGNICATSHIQVDTFANGNAEMPVNIAAQTFGFTFLPKFLVQLGVKLGMGKSSRMSEQSGCGLLATLPIKQLVKDICVYLVTGTEYISRR